MIHDGAPLVYQIFIHLSIGDFIFFEIFYFFRLSFPFPLYFRFRT